MKGNPNILFPLALLCMCATVTFGLLALSDNWVALGGEILSGILTIVFTFWGVCSE